MSNFENDSFDDILATIEEPTRTISVRPNETKKARFSLESEDDSILANFTLPETSTSVQSTAKPVNAPISTGKTNCVLVNPKQRGIFLE